MTPLKVFLDSDILFPAAYRAPNAFERLWKLLDVTLFTSDYCVLEVERNLSSPAQLKNFRLLLQGLSFVPDVPEALLPKTIMLPAKVLPVLAAAMQCEADVLITGDRRHFGAFYGSMQGCVRVDSPEIFWQRFTSDKA